MTASTATADTLLRHAWPLVSRGQLSGLAARSVNSLLGTGAFLLGACPPSAPSALGQAPPQPAEPVPRLLAPVSPGVSAVSSRTLMDNAG